MSKVVRHPVDVEIHRTWPWMMTGQRKRIARAFAAAQPGLTARLAWLRRLRTEFSEAQLSDLAEIAFGTKFGAFQHEGAGS